MFRALLIANRGEIACRIARTARRLGIRSIAVYSDADEGALHVRTADEAVRIGPRVAAESYLNIDAILDAARRAGAEAIHPGYGFLSQNADFADACAGAGVAFVGPRGDSIRAMGRKDEAKALIVAAGVPVVPGWLGDDQSDARLATEARRVGFPILIKAVAGGGGKGMRVVRGDADFAAALEAARGEAKRSFGDDRVLLERFVEQPRHVEVQVIGDRHGRVIHLYERDCSLQRRYQKIIEECPAPGLSAATRERLYAAAVAAARAVRYENAGTVEFIVAGGEVYFLEMNTRLQVEHPVTEAVLGIDLVEWQLRVAAGEPLPAIQEDLPAPQGHAFEARLYAEDPRRGFLPTGGAVQRLRWPGQGVRVDAAVEEGDRVVTDYDALLAKLIVHAPDRDAALDALGRALADTRIEGVTTNLAALVALARDPEVVAARMHTTYVDGRGEALLPPLREQVRRAARVAGQALLAVAPSAADPWSLGDGWQSSDEPLRCVHLEHPVPGRIVLRGADLDTGLDPAGVAEIGWESVTTWLDGERHVFHRVASAAPAAPGLDAGGVRAPMPGVILRVCVQAGASVEAGAPLVVLEAMKMEHTLRAPAPARVIDVRAEAGARVREGDVLVTLEAPADGASLA
jgi:3-methylcrotonyl-CoA carboxylase alpha subunit